jgi:hypothetical protein
MKIVAYAIRHKPTGHYLPGSHRASVKPSAIEPADPAEQMPRLWQAKRHAQSALTIWLRGIYKTTWDDACDNYETRIVEPPIPRRREDMEVVPVEMLVP